MNNEPVAWIYQSMKTLRPALKFAKPIKYDSESAINVDIPLYIHPVKELTDEEINQLWAESHEDGIAMQQGFTTQQHYFAHLILRKAQEK